MAKCDAKEREHSGRAGTLDDSAIVEFLQRVVVVIPALNEAESIPLVLRDLPAVERVIVVDNGSVDATADAAERAGADVVQERQRGYGSACLAGLARIDSLIREGRLPVPEAVAFCDADYSDHVHLLPELVEPLAAGDADFVLGSRLLGECEPGAMPPQAVYGNRFACLCLRWLTGAAFSDLGPFRVIRYRTLSELRMSDRNFGWTIEMQLKAARAGVRIREVPVPYRRRVGRSKISGTVSGTIRAGAKILFVLAKYALARRI